MSNNYTLTEYQVIFGQHDDGFFTRNGTRLRVNRVTGCSPLRHGPMKQIVAEAIDDAEQANRDHTQRKNARFNENYGSGETDSSEDGDSAESSANAALDEMLGGIESDGESDDQESTDLQPQANGGATANSRGGWLVPPNQVRLLEITEDTRVRSSVFPRTFRCVNCNHFELLDPATDDLQCLDCHRQLRQYPLVYTCPRCANVDHLQPFRDDVADDHVGVIDCQNCATGHYHLHHEDSLSNARFECSDCNDTQNVRRFCRECHIPSNEDGEDGASSVMKPTPTDASSIVSPMVKSALFINDEQISLSSLQTAHESRHDPYEWQASDLPTRQENVLKDFWGLDGLFTVTDVRSITAVYGYQTRVTAEGTDVDDDDRLTRTFDHEDGMKRAYVTQSHGRGLVFDLDMDRLLETVKDFIDIDPDTTYEELASAELDALGDQPVKELVDEEHDLGLIPLLHALEHVLFEAAAHEIGMDDVLGSKLLIEDGAIVLYEREEVGSGGLAQLTLGTEGQTLQKYLRKAAEQLSSCGQLCERGCPSCLYTDDFDCRPFLPSEVNRWVPPNALLNRQYAHRFINAY